MTYNALLPNQPEQTQLFNKGIQTYGTYYLQKASRINTS